MNIFEYIAARKLDQANIQALLAQGMVLGAEYMRRRRAQ